VNEIVVGYDGSDCAEAALGVALSLAKDRGDGVVAVFGYAPPGIWGGEIAEHEQAVEELGQRVLEQARQHAAERGVEAAVELVPKRASEALVSVAETHGARMIVVGTHGGAPLKEMILGSTPSKLLHLSPLPVLVVPANPE
jgi:nucleotide-binding universal stress UspA family protein